LFQLSFIKVFIDNQYNIFGLIYAVLAIIILLPISKFLNNYLPFLLGKNIKNIKPN